MPLGIGPMEIVVVLVIGLLVLGPKRLPGVAKSVGSGVRELRDSLADAGGRREPVEEPSEVATVAVSAAHVVRDRQAV